MSDKIIDYSNVEKVMKRVEANLTDLDENEKLLIINFVRERILQKKQKQMTSDVMSNMQVGGMIKQIKKSMLGGE